MFKKNHGIIIQFQPPQIISRIAINYSLDNIRDSKKIISSNEQREDIIKIETRRNVSGNLYFEENRV